MTGLKLIVQKYGETYLESPEKIKAVAERIKRYADRGYSVVATVSAMKNPGNILVDIAEKIASEPECRELDMITSAGEQISAALIAIALNEMGVDAISYNGSQIGLLTNGNFSNALIRSISPERLTKSLEEYKAVIVTGSQGVDRDDNITNLGSGGADTVAVAIAAVLGSRECEIYTETGGVYTADPRIVGNPEKLKEISYDEMFELSRLGSAIVHSRSIEFAKKYGVRVRVRSGSDYEEGTVIMSKEELMERHIISGVTSKNDQAKITIRDIPDKPGIAESLFNALGDNKICVDMIVQSTGKNNLTTISFTILKKDIVVVKDICEILKKEWNASEVSTKEDIAIVSAVGAGMISGYGIAGRMFRTLAAHNINIEMISTSEIGISCVVDAIYSELAVKAIHKEFIESK